MQNHRLLLWSAFFLLNCAVTSFGQTAPDCAKVISAAAMARTTSAAELLALRSNAGSGYLAELVFAARDFELNPKDVARARRLLPLMPRFETENYPDETSENSIRTKIMLAMGDGQCPAESIKDLTALSVLQEALPGLFAKAVILAPEFLPQYIVYDMWAVSDPHNDSNVHTEKVCRAHRTAFAKAVASMDEAQRYWFTEHVFDVRHCRAIALPEADE